MEKATERKTTNFLFTIRGTTLSDEQARIIEAKINSVVMEELAQTDLGEKNAGVANLSSVLRKKRPEIIAKIGEIAGGIPIPIDEMDISRQIESNPVLNALR